MKRLIGIVIALVILLAPISAIPSQAAITELVIVDELSLKTEGGTKVADLSMANGDELGQIKSYVVDSGAAMIYFNGWYAPPKPLLDIGFQTDDGEIQWGFGKNDGTGSVVAGWAGFDENGPWTLRANGGIPIQEGSHTFKVVAQFTDDTTKVIHSAHYYNDDDVHAHWGNISNGTSEGQRLDFEGAYSAAAFTANAPFEGVQVPVVWCSNNNMSKTISFDFLLYSFDQTIANSMNGTPLASVRFGPVGTQPYSVKMTFSAFPSGQYVLAVKVVECAADAYVDLPESGDPTRATYGNNLSGEQTTKTFNFGVNTIDPENFFGPVPSESVAEDDGVKLLISADMLSADGNTYLGLYQHELLTEEETGMPFARFTSNNADPNVGFNPIPSTDATNKYAAVKYRTSDFNVTATFYTLVAEPHVKDLNLEGDGEWHIQIVDLTLSPGDGTNTSWNGEFHRLDPSNQSDVTVDYAWIAIFADRDAAEAYQGPTLTPATPRMTVESMSARGGDTASINVSIENNPGILGATFKLYYANGLTLTQVENGNAFGDLTVPANLRSGCTLTWDEIDIDPAAVVREGTVVTLTFNVAQGLNDNAFLPITIEYESGDIIDLNLESVDLEIVNGGVTVFNYMPGDVNNDGRINSLDVILVRRYIVDGCTTDPEGYNISLIEAAADVNDDGRINSLDVIMIRRYIADGCTTDPEGYNIELKPSCHFNQSGIGGNENTQNDEGETEEPKVRIVVGESETMVVPDATYCCTLANSEDNLVVTTADGGANPWISIPLDNIDTSVYTSFTVKYTINGTLIVNNVYLRDTEVNMDYSGLTGSWTSPSMNGHTERTFVIANDFPTMVGTFLTGVRFPGAVAGGTFVIESITFNEDSGGSTSERMIVFDFPKMGLPDKQNVTSPLTKDGVTVTFDKADGSTVPVYYENGTGIRVYPNNTIKVESTKTITKVVFEFTQEIGGFSADSGTYSSPTWNGSASSVTFTKTESKHHRIKSITVILDGES